MLDGLLGMELREELVAIPRKPLCLKGHLFLEGEEVKHLMEHGHQRVVGVWQLVLCLLRVDLE